MNIRRIGRVFTQTIGLSSLLLVSIVAASRTEPSVDLPTLARQRLAKKTRQSVSNFTLLNSTEVNYQLQREKIHESKFMDKEGVIHIISLNQRGQEVNSEQLQANEEVAYTTRYGKVDSKLAQKLAVTPANKPISVILWLKEPLSTSSSQLPDSYSGDFLPDSQVQEFFNQVDANRAAEVQSIVTPVANRLRNLNRNVTTDRFAPVVYATLTPQQISQVAQLPEVDQVYEDLINYPELNIASLTIRATTVQNRGLTGVGIRVAQIEVGGRVATNNPNLSGIFQNTTDVCSSASSHSTAVAGIIRSTNGIFRGISPRVSLWAGGSCNGNSSQLQNRSTAAADWGARILNLSWGSNTNLVISASDRFYDNMVINRLRTVVKSAGNRGSGCGFEGNVTSPGLAYNVITVGNFDDKRTVSWTGDTMSSCSSWRNPRSARGDRKKPELAAPGTNITGTTTASPWIGRIGSGTSYSTPMVTGVVALLMQRNSSLSSLPEAVKAILMTTAIHNIEGNARLSEYDGAGGIVADRADDVARRVNGNWGSRSYTCSTSTTLDVANMSLTAGVRTRATIVWPNDPNYSSYASQPGADLDLQVISPSGSVVASSASWDNTYEIVDFRPSVSGNYRLRVRRTRCSYNPRRLAWAWRRGN